MNKNKLLIGCSSVLALSLLLAAVAGYFIYQRFARFFSMIHTEMPAELKQPRVIAGQELLEKASFLQVKRLGRISSILYGKFDPSLDSELCIVGQTGALFLDEQGNQKDSVTFAKAVETVLGFKAEGTNRRYGQIDVVDVDGDHIYEFLVRENLNGAAELIGHDGKTIWTYDEGDGENSFLEDMTAGDIDGDGKAEYVAAYLNGKGLVLLDHSRKEIWSKPEVHANTVQMLDTDGSGKLKILHDAYTQIVLRDTSGNVLSGGETGNYIGHFSLVRWPSKKDRQYALHFSHDVTRLLDYNGKTVKEFNAPLSKDLYRVHGITVKLKAEGPEYFAAVAESIVYERSVFYVYNSTGSLVYQEILPEAYESIAAFPLGLSGREAILLGGDGEVIEYKMNDPAR
ncbi:MAG TPA: hypothetical protein VKA60_04395 [Blastocatellia bacterium]|nr:hypothetical protein [Blastocatellia bacterium]